MRVLAAANVALTQKRAGRRGQPSLRLAAAYPHGFDPGQANTPAHAWVGGNGGRL